MNLVFIYLGEECLVIIYSVSELAMGKVPVCLQPGFFNYFLEIKTKLRNVNKQKIENEYQ